MDKKNLFANPEFFGKKDLSDLKNLFDEPNANCEDYNLSKNGIKEYQKFLVEKYATINHAGSKLVESSNPTKGSFYTTPIPGFCFEKYASLEERSSGDETKNLAYDSL